MDDKQKHYKFIPCKTDDLGMKLEWETNQMLQLTVTGTGGWIWMVMSNSQG